MLAVTGATGFLGQALVGAALDAGYGVRALVRARARTKQPGLDLVEGDHADAASMRRLLAGAEVLVHLAATGVQARDRTWGGMLDVNIRWPVALIEAAAEAGVHRVVATGTVLEYRGHGSLPDQLAPEGALCDEDASLEAVDSYGATKAAGGLLLRARARELSVPCWYLRLAALYGPRDDPQKLLPSAVAAARERRTLAMSGGLQVREWLHVRDACAAILAAAARDPGRSTPVVNVGNGEGVVSVELVHRLYELAGAPRDLVEAGARPYRQGEPHRLVMSTARCRECLPEWRPKVVVDQGLAELVAQS